MGYGRLFIQLILAAALVTLPLSLPLVAVAQTGSTPKLKDSLLAVEHVASGLNFPTSLAFLDNSTILVTEKNNGQLAIVFSNGTIKYESPAIDVPVNSYRERGLLGVAIWEGMLNQASNATGGARDNKTYVFLYFTESNGQNPLRNTVYR